MTETPQTRGGRSYLLDGRRVRVADLIENGLLVPSAAIIFVQRRHGKRHTATVRADGVIELDGQEFTSPSGAGSVAAGGIAVDGWHAWVDVASGRTLDSLRAELLDRVPVNADGFVAGSEESVRAQRRHVFLKEARAEADAGRPRGISVRNLLALWGAQARGLRINLRIEADLANHGLVTAPSFRKVTLDATVDLIGSAASESAAQHVESVPTEEADDLDVGLTVGNLPSALGGVVSVPPEASFDEAITLMLLNDYSQLAVLSGKRTLRGAVTWKSIARLRHLNPSATLANAIVHVAPVRYDQDLIEILSALESQDFVLVRDGHNAISGIVTTADVVAVYGQLSTPFFLIGQLDQSLRRVMSRYFRLDEIRRRCDTDGTGRIESFDDLTMGDYLRVLENQECWAKLNWPLHRSAFVKRLDELREIRNEIMHFNPDPLPADAVDKLRNILRVLRECVG